MAGRFELFLDEASGVRFRMVGPDGTELGISRPYPDTRAAAAGIEAMRECAGTGLISNLCPDIREPATARTAKAPTTAAKSPATSTAAQRVHRKGLYAA